MSGVPGSSPPPGTFDIECDTLVVKGLGDYNKMMDVKAFCVGRERVKDFLKGEAERGDCQLIRQNTYKAGEYYHCCYGKERKTSNQVKAAKGPALELGPGERRSRIGHGESGKLGCAYTLTWREIQRDGQTVAAFFVGNGARHSLPSEAEPVHGPGVLNFVHLKVTDDCKGFVKKQLLLGSNPGQIFESAQPRCFSKCALQREGKTPPPKLLRHNLSFSLLFGCFVSVCVLSLLSPSPAACTSGV